MGTIIMDGADGSGPPPPDFILVSNFFEELNRLVPE